MQLKVRAISHLSVYLFVSNSLSMSVSLSLSLNLFQSLSLSISLFCLFLYLSTYLSACMYVYLPTYLSLSISIPIPVSFSIFVSFSTYPYIHLFLPVFGKLSTFKPSFLPIIWQKWFVHWCQSSNCKPVRNFFGSSCQLTLLFFATFTIDMNWLLPMNEYGTCSSDWHKAVPSSFAPVRNQQLWWVPPFLPRAMHRSQILPAFQNIRISDHIGEVHCTMNPIASKDFARLQSFCCQDWIIQLGQLGLLFLPWVRRRAQEKVVFLPEPHLHRHNRYWSRFQAKINHNQLLVSRVQMSQIYPKYDWFTSQFFILSVRTEKKYHVKLTIQRVPYAKEHIREPTAYLRYEWQWKKRSKTQYLFLWNMFRSSVVRKSFTYQCKTLNTKNIECHRDVASNSRAHWLHFVNMGQGDTHMSQLNDHRRSIIMTW